MNIDFSGQFLEQFSLCKIAIQQGKSLVYPWNIQSLANQYANGSLALPSDSQKQLEVAQAVQEIRERAGHTRGGRMVFSDPLGTREDTSLEENIELGQALMKTVRQVLVASWNRGLDANFFPRKGIDLNKVRGLVGDLETLVRETDMLPLSERARYIRSARTGSCALMATLAVAICPRGVICTIRGGNHLFVLLGEGENAVIIDPWAEDVYPFAHLKDHLKNFIDFPRNGDKPLVERFDPNAHSISIYTEKNQAYNADQICAFIFFAIRDTAAWINDVVLFSKKTWKERLSAAPVSFNLPEELTFLLVQEMHSKFSSLERQAGDICNRALKERTYFQKTQAERGDRAPKIDELITDAVHATVLEQCLDKICAFLVYANSLEQRCQQETSGRYVIMQQKPIIKRLHAYLPLHHPLRNQIEVLSSRLRENRASQAQQEVLARTPESIEEEFDAAIYFPQEDASEFGSSTVKRSAHSEEASFRQDLEEFLNLEQDEDLVSLQKDIQKDVDEAGEIVRQLERFTGSPNASCRFLLQNATLRRKAAAEALEKMRQCIEAENPNNARKAAQTVRQATQMIREISVWFYECVYRT